MNTQRIPPSTPLVVSMPSGREIHSTKTYIPPNLDAETLAQMRAPPEPDENPDEGGSSSSENEDGKKQDALPGTFPDSSNPAAGDSYY